MEQIFTPKEFQLYLKGLPKKYTAATGKVQQEMAMNLAQKIGNRAPVGSTGSLRTQIEEKKTKFGWQIVGPGHWSFVNAGVYPTDKNGNPMMLPLEVARAHQANPGSTAGKKVNIPRDSIDGWFQVDSSRIGEGFVDKAIVAFEDKIDKIISMGMNKVFKK
jgi:hypothetical protein